MYLFINLNRQPPVKLFLLGEAELVNSNAPLDNKRVNLTVFTPSVFKVQHLKSNLTDSWPLQSTKNTHMFISFNFL